MACFFARIENYKIEKTDKNGILNKKICVHMRARKRA